MRRGQYARALRLSLFLIRRDPYRRICCHPLHPLSKEKAVRSLFIDIDTEKNQKKWKLLTGKTGRFCQKI
jgi:hypothetical protein